MWSIDKSFSFEMGHRVWQQKLDKPELSLTTDCACKHLHGHSYEIKVFLEGDSLNNEGMILDFKNLNWVKQFLDDELDHKFMIDVNDPLFTRITGCSFSENEHVTNFSNLGDVMRNIGEFEDKNKDFIDSFVLVNFCPTSENICMHLKELFAAHLKGVADVEAVELWETKKSHCRYS